MQPKTEEALPAGSTVITAIEVKVASVSRRRTKKHLLLKFPDVGWGKRKEKYRCR